MKLYSFFAIVAAALMLVACGNNQNNKAAESVEAQAVVIDSLFADGEALVGQLIEIEGVCTHICSHSASKIFLLGDGGQTLRVEAAELGSFAQECVNSVVKVQGVLCEERIADFRTKIAARAEAEGKEYLSFYFVEAQAYEIVE